MKMQDIVAVLPVREIPRQLPKNPRQFFRRENKSEQPTELFASVLKQKYIEQLTSPYVPKDIISSLIQSSFHTYSTSLDILKSGEVVMIISRKPIIDFYA